MYLLFSSMSTLICSVCFLISSVFCCWVATSCSVHCTFTWAHDHRLFSKRPRDLLSFKIWQKGTPPLTSIILHCHCLFRCQAARALKRLSLTFEPHASPNVRENILSQHQRKPCIQEIHHTSWIESLLSLALTIIAIYITEKPSTPPISSW